MKLSKAFALKVSKLLNERNISKYRLEKETGITHSALRYIFNEANADIRFSTICKVVAFFGLTLPQFFDDPIFDLTTLDYEL